MVDVSPSGVSARGSCSQTDWNAWHAAAKSAARKKQPVAGWSGGTPRESNFYIKTTAVIDKCVAVQKFLPSCLALLLASSCFSRTDSSNLEPLCLSEILWVCFSLRLTASRWCLSSFNERRLQVRVLGLAFENDGRFRVCFATCVVSPSCSLAETECSLRSPASCGCMFIAALVGIVPEGGLKLPSRTRTATEGAAVRILSV